MTGNNTPSITELEIANSRHNLELLRSQLKSGRLNPDFLVRQIDKLDQLLQRVGDQQHDTGQKQRFEALYNVSRVLGSSLDLQIVLNQVMDSIIQLTGAERGFLMLRDDDGGITVKAARNFDQQTLESRDFKFSRTVTNEVMDSGEPILTTNASEDPRFAGKASIIAQSLRSVMATPLRARGSVIGAIYVDSQATAGLFRDEDLAALDAFSAQAAIALDNAMLFSATDDALSERIEQLRQLRRIDRLLNETLDLDKAMSFTLEWVARMAEADQSYLGFLEGDGHTIRTVHYYGLESEPPEELTELFPEAAQVVATRATLRIGNSLIVPIQREQNMMGVIVLKRPDYSPFTFTEEQQDLVERIVARAAVTIENAQLYTAVQEADRAKSEFVGVVAHDLKSPMTGIKGYTEMMLMDAALPEEYKGFLTRIKDTVERMAILVSDLADISRIESGYFFMDETRVQVNAVIQAIKESTLPQFQERNHIFVEQVEDNLPKIWVDYYRLVQVLTNLVSNAYKYTPDGGTITLSASRKADRIEFSVKDTGIGLSEENLKKLGTKFWRADDEFTRSQPGTGLGFSITKGLVQQMGGDIKIESKVGKGSTFIFSVPIDSTEK